MKWAGHIVRMNEDRITKKVSNAQPIGSRRKGRPNHRWIYGVEKDILVLRTSNWRTLSGRRLTWKCFLRGSKPILGCRATEEGRGHC
ncbi:uncharacterized protein TNCV_725501 [Trichonephila clavipes]|nr:uncharacterized protein TNCV_725501 [Trichonephila clavipes]